jgi:hypothetical protein
LFSKISVYFEIVVKFSTSSRDLIFSVTKLILYL